MPNITPADAARAAEIWQHSADLAWSAGDRDAAERYEATAEEYRRIACACSSAEGAANCAVHDTGDE